MTGRARKREGRSRWYGLNGVKIRAVGYKIYIRLHGRTYHRRGYGQKSWPTFVWQGKNYTLETFVNRYNKPTAQSTAASSANQHN